MVPIADETALRTRGKEVPSPAAGLYGPKVMIVNESAGSGGDALPYYFRLRQLGPLVGTRTWGALVGTSASRPRSTAVASSPPRSRSTT